MDENMSEMFNNVKKMVDSGNIPSELQQMMNNLKNSSSSSPNQSNNSDINNILSQVSPEMINNLNNMLNSNKSNNSNNSSNNSSNGQSNFNIDMNTIMKMKSIMENMNDKNDPRANLLYSLKPYLRDSKKDKLDQYVNMMNMTKIVGMMNNNKKDNDKNG